MSCPFLSEEICPDLCLHGVYEYEFFKYDFLKYEYAFLLHV